MICQSSYVLTKLFESHRNGFAIGTANDDSATLNRICESVDLLYSPGFCATNLYDDMKIGISQEEFFALGGKAHPLRERAIDVDEVADAVMFLSSDSARMITGVSLNVDGGRSLVSH